jgi:hypothetical protein
MLMQVVGIEPLGLEVLNLKLQWKRWNDHDRYDCINTQITNLHKEFRFKMLSM